MINLHYNHSVFTELSNTQTANFNLFVMRLVFDFEQYTNILFSSDIYLKDLEVKYDVGRNIIPKYMAEVKRLDLIRINYNLKQYIFNPYVAYKSDVTKSTRDMFVDSIYV